MMADDKRLPIAVVGLSCRFPGGATTPQKLWDLVAKGKSAWSEIPSNRMDINDYYHPNGNRQGSICFRGAHFVEEDPFLWDASFFETSAKEAIAIDPQQRWLLEVTYEALESAGISRESIDGSDTGVFCGSFVKDYEQLCLKDPDDAPQYAATGNGIALLSNRISYSFNLKGPSMTVDTGCSASLVCFHQACQSLISGESDMAIVAGPGLILTPNTMMPMMGLNFLSPDGKCYTFDSRANGYGRGEGVGVIILKRLDDAITDRNPIRCVVRGTSINQDGKTLQGITVPSKEAQASNIRNAYNQAGLGYDKTAFVECHGTGTQAGDSRELGAIAETIAHRESRPVVVGSIKTNIGHLEGAAGVAGITKMILCLEKGMIPKHINFKGNPALDFDKMNLEVPLKTMNWPVDGLRRGSVNCFGFGGANAHVIMDDAANYLQARGNKYSMHKSVGPFALAERPIDFTTKGKAFLFPYSAHDKCGIKRMAEAHAAYLRTATSTAPESFLADYSYTLAERRSVLGWKSCVIARSVHELISKLENIDAVSLTKSSDAAGPVGVVFAFCGQGAQWFAMGRDLIVDFPDFSQSVRDASYFLTTKLGADFDIFEELGRPLENSKVDEPHISQPATTILQMALVDFLFDIGIKPIAVIGHSSGEIAAAYAKGAILREDAWKIAYYRGRAALELGQMDVKGGMLAVWKSHEDVQVILNHAGCEIAGEDTRGTVSVACINSPEHTTISGDTDNLERVEVALKEADIRCTRIRVSVAYHSHHMRLVEDSYREKIKTIKTIPDRLQIPMFSSVWGREANNSELGPDYWCENMASPVRFAKAVSKLVEFTQSVEKQSVIMELSPHGILRLHLETMLSGQDKALSYVSLLTRGKDGSAALLGAIGEIFQHRGNYPHGFSASKYICKADPNAGLHICLDLPPYPFNHDTRYIWDSHLEQARQAMHLRDQRQDIIGRPVPSGSEPEIFRWRHFLRPDENPWILHHVVDGALIYPAAGLIAMVVQAGFQISQHPGALRDLTDSIKVVEIVGIKVTDMVFLKAMSVPSSSRGLEVNLTAIRKRDDSTSFEIVITSTPSGLLNSRGTVQIVTADDKVKSQHAGLYQHMSNMILDETRHVDNHTTDVGQFYNELSQVGLNYGPLFRGISAVSRNEERDKGAFTVTIPDTASSMPHQYEFDHLIHPATLDSIFQSISVLNKTPLQLVPTKVGLVYIPMNVVKGAGNILKGTFEARKRGKRKATADIIAMGGNGNRDPVPIVIINGLKVECPVPETIPDNQGLCSKISWNREVNYLGNQTIELCDWIQLLAHKKPGLALLIMDVPQVRIQAILENMSGSETPLAVRKIVFVGSKVAQYRHAQKYGCRVDFYPLLKERPADSIPGSEVFDLVITSNTAFDIETLQPRLVDGGAVLELLPMGASQTQFKPSLGSPFVSSGTMVVWRAEMQPPATFFSLYIPHQMSILGDQNTVTIVVPGDIGTPLQSLLGSLTARLETVLGLKVHHLVLPRRLGNINFNTSSHQLGHYCISLMEVESTYIAKWGPKDFEAFKDLFSRAPKLIWITRGAWPECVQRPQTAAGGGGDPEAAMFWGMARTIISEGWANMLPVVVDIDANMGPEGGFEVYAEPLVSIFRHVFLQDRKYLHNILDREFMLLVDDKTSAIYVPRLVPLQRLNHRILRSEEHDDVLESGLGTEDSRTKWQPHDTLGVLQKDVNFDEYTVAKPMQSSMQSSIITGSSMVLSCNRPSSVATTPPSQPVNMEFPPSPTSMTLKVGVFEEPQLDPKAVYLIVGGLGGLGRIITQLMIDIGAKRFAFICRPGGSCVTDEALAWKASFRTVDIAFYQADITKYREIKMAMDQIEADFDRPISGIVMAAAVLSDAAFEGMTFSKWQPVIDVKAHGSINLSLALAHHQPLDFFIMLSSAAGVIGNMTQANYNAANVVQDSLACHLSAQGQHAVALCLGPVMGAGMLARDQELAQKLLATGFIGVSLRDFGILFKAAMGSTPASPSLGRGGGAANSMVHTNTVVGVGTGGLECQNNPKNPFWAGTALYSYLGRVDLPEGSGQGRSGGKMGEDAERLLGEVKERLAQARTREDSRVVVAMALVEAVVQEVGNRTVDDVDVSGESPASLGIDSLTGIGVRDWIRKALGVGLSIMEITGGMTFLDLAEVMVERM